MTTPTRSHSATGPSITNWRDLARSSNFELLHSNRHGRNSTQDIKEKEDSDFIPKEYIETLFKAIENEDLMRLLNIIHVFDKMNIPRNKIREWFIYKARKNNQTALITACCKGNLSIVQILIEHMFIGPQNEQERQYLQRIASTSTDLDHSLSNASSNNSGTLQFQNSVQEDLSLIANNTHSQPTLKLELDLNYEGDPIATINEDNEEDALLESIHELTQSNSFTLNPDNSLASSLPQTTAFDNLNLNSSVDSQNQIINSSNNSYPLSYEPRTHASSMSSSSNNNNQAAVRFKIESLTETTQTENLDASEMTSESLHSSSENLMSMMLSPERLIDFSENEEILCDHTSLPASQEALNELNLNSSIGLDEIQIPQISTSIFSSSPTLNNLSIQTPRSNNFLTTSNNNSLNTQISSSGYHSDDMIQPMNFDRSVSTNDIRSQNSFTSNFSTVPAKPKPMQPHQQSTSRRQRHHSYTYRRHVKYIKDLGTFLEIRGTIKCDDDNIDGASGLWAAASFGHNEICRYLISKGADIHTRTNAGSTPLRCACYDGHLETAKILIEHGADIEAANKHGHTCLMIACYREQVEVVKYLLDKGVDVNKTGNRGSTALHDTAEKGSLAIFKLLINAGGRLDLKDKQGQTALISAAVSGAKEVIDYVEQEIDISVVGIGHLVNAKELLGCWYIDRERDYHRGLRLWREGLVLRAKHNFPKKDHGRNSIANTTLAIRDMIKLFEWDENLDCPIDIVFPSLNEFANLSDLLQLYQDQNLMRNTSQLVRFRILGPDHPDCSMYMRTRGAQLADQGDWHRCSKIWLITMILHLKYRDPICLATIQHFVASIQLFQHMLASSIVQPGVNSLDFRDIICTIEGAFLECQRWYKNKAYCFDDIDTPEDRANKILRYTLILTNFALLCMQPEHNRYVKNSTDPKLIQRLKNCLSKQANLRSPNSPSLLHIAASQPIKFNKFKDRS